jgi:hypothetical protein
VWKALNFLSQYINENQIKKTPEFILSAITLLTLLAKSALKKISLIEKAGPGVPVPVSDFTN